jgi:hypothetical protein
METGGGTLVLRLAAPALTLAREGLVIATLGDGPDAWPPPPPQPEREWDRVPPSAIESAMAEAGEAGRSPTRFILGACPGLGPVLARELDSTPGTAAASFEALRARLAVPAPTVFAPGPREEWHDADLIRADSVVLAPVALEWPGSPALHPETWSEAAALFLEARYRGASFEERRRRVLNEARRQVRRLGQLEANLARDREGLPDEAGLRRQGEALLAFGSGVEPGQSVVDLADPYEPGRRFRIALDPRKSAPANADRYFEKARRIERSRRQIETRLGDTRASLLEAQAREAAALEARDAGFLEAAHPAPAPGPSEERGGPRHYLTARGLSILVGRGARENHHLTFAVARPEDLWLHARDVPGAHVILRDNEGRAAADDLREAAETAAFFSEARGEASVDVHVTRRKHLRPARGGPGRVFIGHSDTLRAIPRDPEGRLRRR